MPKHKAASGRCSKNKYHAKTHDTQEEAKDNNSFVFVTFDLCKIGYMILKYLSTLSTRSVQNEIGINKYQNIALRKAVKQSTLLNNSLPMLMADVDVANIPVARSFAHNIITRKHEVLFFRCSDSK